MKFVSFINFTDQGIRDVGQTTTRAAEFIEQAKERGAEVHELLWMSGRFDGLMIFDAPDTETAAAVMLMLSKSGNVKTETLMAFDSVGMNQVLANRSRIVNVVTRNVAGETHATRACLFQVQRKPRTWSFPACAVCDIARFVTGKHCAKRKKVQRDIDGRSTEALFSSGSSNLTRNRA